MIEIFGNYVLGFQLGFGLGYTAKVTGCMFAFLVSRYCCYHKSEKVIEYFGLNPQALKRMVYIHTYIHTYIDIYMYIIIIIIIIILVLNIFWNSYIIIIII